MSLLEIRSILNGYMSIIREITTQLRSKIKMILRYLYQTIRYHFATNFRNLRCDKRQTQAPRDGFKPKTCADCVVNSSRSSRSFAYRSTLKLSILFLARNLRKPLGKSIFIYYIMKYCKILEKKTQLNSASSLSSRSWLIVSELTVAWQGLTEKFDTNHRKPWQLTPVIWPCGDINSPKGWNRLHEPK